MKKEFVTPVVEYTALESDVICTSGCSAEMPDDGN